MYLVDKKFSKYKKNYFIQAFMTGLFVFMALFALGGFREIHILAVAGATALGSSAFVAFAAHDSHVAQARCILGGYAIGLIVSIGCWKIAHVLTTLAPILMHYNIYELLASIAIVITMLIMTIFDLEHPPAVSLSVGFVVQYWTFTNVLIIITAVILLVILKWAFRRFLVNLF